MTPEAQRIAIAEACGWSHCKPSGMGREKGIHPLNQKFSDAEHAYWQIPDYLNDLNAMHEASMSQTAEFRMKMNNILIEMMPVTEPYQLDRTINATASQRAEAFLRTLNLWKD